MQDVSSHRPLGGSDARPPKADYDPLNYAAPADYGGDPYTADPGVTRSRAYTACRLLRIATVAAVLLAAVTLILVLIILVNLPPFADAQTRFAAIVAGAASVAVWLFIALAFYTARTALLFHVAHTPRHPR